MSHVKSALVVAIIAFAVLAVTTRVSTMKSLAGL
jgi:hypothetical protein